MHIALCDDEPDFVDKLEEMLTREFANHNKRCRFFKVSGGDELLKLCLHEKIDAVFLDIAMPGFDGFETAKRLLEIRKNIMIVFVSGKESAVFDSYEYDPVWFVLKSNMEYLERTVAKLIEKSEKTKAEIKFVNVRLDNTITEIDVREIKYFKTTGHYINYYTRSGEISESYRGKLSDLEVQLASQWFVKTHNRYLVNLRWVRSVSNSCLNLHDGEKVPVSKSQAGVVREKFQDYFRSVR